MAWAIDGAAKGEIRLDGPAEGLGANRLRRSRPPARC